MNARFLCAVLLLCFGFGAHAVDLYEFEGYFVSKKDGSDPAAQFPEVVGEKFHGWIVYDGDRKFLREEHFHNPARYAAPLVSVYLETEFGYTFSSTNNDGSIGFSVGSVITPPQPVDMVGYGVNGASDGFIYVSGAPFHRGFSFLWASTETGQVPEVDLESSSADPPAPVFFRRAGGLCR
jgi:hypothetical protein